MICAAGKQGTRGPESRLEVALCLEVLLAAARARQDQCMRHVGRDMLVGCGERQSHK